ncbi:thiolase family protein [Mycobacteroides abscessus subsp. abscessus]|uniref:thiolase family protein n=1 Tax=Mycobacteroides abscessus TaxID=36809 RepID=UPI0019CF50FD|nr:thiolase family protein [Mycobacteroides abscessus]MBN7450195.1 thiolase family protein [Mycobacteroides abscessus subsp. abscessus]
MEQVFVVDGVRTAQGRYGGALASVRPDDLAARVIAEVVARAGVPADAIGEVILGAANQAGEDNRNVARMAALLAGLPNTVPGYTVNRLCASGLTAISSAAQAIRAGEADIVVAGGVESMTRAPWVMAKPSAPWARPGEVVDTSLGWRFTNPRFAQMDAGIAADAGPETVKVTLPMGETAEEVAVAEGISREDSDAFALRSHVRALAAQDAGRFVKEIVPIETVDGVVDTDEGPRRQTTLAKLAALRPVFRAGGIVTAGSSSPLSDGAAAVVLAGERAVRQHGLTVRARVVAAASAGVAPNLMGLGPVPAVRKVVDRAGGRVDAIDATEINEAFAAQTLAVLRSLGLDEDTVNADGGAIALGHPLGCSGARLIVTLLNRLEREGASRGLATLCVGVGQGVAMLIEAP